MFDGVLLSTVRIGILRRGCILGGRQGFQVVSFAIITEEEGDDDDVQFSTSTF